MTFDELKELERSYKLTIAHAGEEKYNCDIWMTVLNSDDTRPTVHICLSARFSDDRLNPATLAHHPSAYELDLARVITVPDSVIQDANYRARQWWEQTVELFKRIQQLGVDNQSVNLEEVMRKALESIRQVSVGSNNNTQVIR